MFRLPLLKTRPTENPLKDGGAEGHGKAHEDGEEHVCHSVNGIAFPKRHSEQDGHGVHQQDRRREPNGYAQRVAEGFAEPVLPGATQPQFEHEQRASVDTGRRQEIVGRHRIVRGRP